MNRYLVGLKNFSYCAVYADRFVVNEKNKIIDFFIGDKDVVFFQIVDISTIELLIFDENDESYKQLVYQEEKNG